MFNFRDRKSETGAEDKTALIISYDLARHRDILLDLHLRISDFATMDAFYEEYELALYEYFEWRDIFIEDGEAPDDFFRDEEEFERFMSWYSLYFITDGHNKTFPALFRQQNRYQLSPFEEEILKSYAGSYIGLYEVQQVDPGKGFEVKDLFTARLGRIHDASFSRILCTWDVIYAGFVSGRGLSFMSGFDPVIIPPRLKGTLTKSVLEMYQAEREGCGTLEEFLRIHSAEVGAMIEKALDGFSEEPLRNSEGDILCRAILHYRIADPDAFGSSISQSPFFGRTSSMTGERSLMPRETYTWVRQAREGLKIYETPPLGILTVEKNRFKVECNSKERAKRLKHLLEDLFGDLIQYRTTIYEDPEARIPLWDGLRANPSALESDYKNWLDEEVPALGGMTPREAALAPDGRERLTDLLKELENENEKVLRLGLKNDGHTVFPVDWIREELGL
jgi:hypothetical protein